ncbi:LuxR C-terminal-related transcriptional regulator [Parasphingorhabdus cellanae]|uniref:LuxR family transcriptional regulator n=1 Tax=Parasphingorhabdus cellanae TaxID=2806553 RepID=A0ABX7T6Q2_9SPHN|nr:LuxR C-terminal-related transcriptional regulator [Parasphingorhabdus cellanae]QTD56144.1 LuxR family transcriptional regulator [Parasphingorhabdus cellanae]
MTDQRPSGGIASSAQEQRTTTPERQGTGVDDIEQLAALIARIKDNEQATDAAQKELRIGEFQVEGWRVPESYLGPLQTLSRTEAAVMRFLGWGRSNADIASLLNIHDNTVRTHLNNAIGKLEVDGSRGLVALAGLLFHPVN